MGAVSGILSVASKVLPVATAAAGMLKSSRPDTSGEQAADVQYQAAQAGIEEQRRQFDKLVELMSPYVTAGTGALSQQQALLGLTSPAAQQQAISAIEQSPTMTAFSRQAENAILQNAAATGGLRGGDTQAALAQFRPQLLSGLIEQQYGRLGGLTQVGQASGAFQAAQGMNLGENTSDLFGRGAAAQAMGIAARANRQRQSGINLMDIGGALMKAKSSGLLPF